jgi:hypothetical protein
MRSIRLRCVSLQVHCVVEDAQHVNAQALRVRAEAKQHDVTPFAASPPHVQREQSFADLVALSGAAECGAFVQILESGGKCPGVSSRLILAQMLGRPGDDRLEIRFGRGSEPHQPPDKTGHRPRRQRGAFLESARSCTDSR